MLAIVGALALSHAIGGSQRVAHPRRCACVCASIENSEWRCTLNVGREKGTWMPDDWAASGARLSLPLILHFTDEPTRVNDNALGRGGVVKRLQVVNSGGTFIGKAGEEFVECVGGAWVATPRDVCGESIVRFFIDFPGGATRNDVSIPAGRVIFSTSCWDGAEMAAASADAAKLEQELEEIRTSSDGASGEQNLLQSALSVRGQVLQQDRVRSLTEQLRFLKRALPDSRGTLDVDGVDTKLAKGGGLVIRRSDARNLWGALHAEYEEDVS